MNAHDYNETIILSILDAERGYYDGAETGEAILRVLDDCLDVEVHVVHSLRSSWTKRIELLRSYGGPTTRISLDLNGEHGYLLVRTWLGDELAERRIYAPEMCAVLDETASYVLEAAKDRDDA